MIELYGDGKRKLDSHQRLLQTGDVVRWNGKMKGKILFISHEWLSLTHPDPESEQITTLLTVLSRLRSGSIERVQSHYLQRILMKENKITRASEWKGMLRSAWIWLDYVCIPQKNHYEDLETTKDDGTATKCGVRRKSKAEELYWTNQLKNAIESLPGYVELSDLVVVLAPTCEHKNRKDEKTGLLQTTCWRSWRGRGWCLAEMLCAFVSRREVDILVMTSKQGTPFWTSTMDATTVNIDTADFTCCAKNHVMNGRVMSCDKVKVRTILRSLILSKVRHLRYEGRAFDARWYMVLGNRWTCDNIGQDQADRNERNKANGNLDMFAKRLLLENHAKLEADEGGMTLLMWAAALNDFDAIIAVLTHCLNKLRHRQMKKYVNKTLPRNGVERFGVPGGRNALHLACMHSKSIRTVKYLIENNVNPKSTDVNGWDPLMVAAAAGNVDVVTYWLSTFPDWNLERREWTAGNSVLHIAIGRGRKKGPVLNALLQASVDIDQRSWSGATALMHACSNEDADVDMVTTLLYNLDLLREIKWKNGRPVGFGGVHRVNKKLLPQTIYWIIKHWYRRVIQGRVSMTLGATALHFAASRGDLDVTRVLLMAGARMSNRTNRGMSALDFSRHYGPYPRLANVLEAAEKDEAQGKNKLAIMQSMRVFPLPSE